MRLAKPLQNLIESFEKLPGIGPKTAQRLGFYLLHVPQSELEEFANALIFLKKNTVECEVCYNVSESTPCQVCFDKLREKSIICVVEQPIDIISIEKTGKYFGSYHVLHGRIDPLNNIRPEDLRIKELIKKIDSNNRKERKIQEIILALNPDMEGEATAMYIVAKLKTINPNLKVTRLAYGLPTGASIEYADETTLTKAFEGRSEY